MTEFRRAVPCLLLALVVLAQTGCSGLLRQQEQDPAQPTASAAPSEPTGTSAPDPTTAPGVSGSAEAERLALMAVQELARRTGVPEGEIYRVSVSAETWSDASLGCPEPGRAYAQVLTPGYRVVLEARGQRYEYHTDEKRVVLCSRP